MKSPVIPLALLIAASFEASATAYIPEKQIDIRVREVNLSCNLYYSRDYREVVDYCDNQASIDINYNVAMMRSIRTPISDTGTYTKDAKFVRFSVAQNTGTGAGIHLRDNLIQDNTWKFDANRTTRVGPFANSYSFWVRATGGITPLITHKLPENKNPNYKHSMTSSISIGINGKVGAQSGESGPKGSGEVGFSFGYSQSRTLSWDSNEYRIRNTSSGSDFGVTWERTLTDCQLLLWTEAGGCHFTRDWGWGGNMWDEARINPIAYSNFTPSLDVLYEVPVSETGQTRFEVGAEVFAKAQYGVATPTPLFFSFFEPAGWSKSAIRAWRSVIIDWSHPIFEPEGHVTLQSLNHNNLCLDVEYNSKEAGADVIGYGCHKNWNQTWGLDDSERYRSRVAADRCLTVDNDLTLSVQSCGYNLNQKWYWEEDKLISRYTDGSDTRYVLTLDEYNQVLVMPEEQATRTRWQPKLNIPVY